ncbi:unnamed protein product (macronuclear) [Paramecium tetraurelia]|uniref:Cyclic nucleotide-binding domain-containing protein n=1 Tax=Paramecium tetraurelia TaxID=5888 RepID=A0EBL1_PARTE|nr:uncharacterized protein GSPATT00025412001 [Paramecium tetraurelia]CAK92678.1 unnamed protein product [Paramecium tetraurelia]|eukprot:XP_001460075.1 hypothetical protein (macronuclear) [Paramecium tetraurelia strain d4-2]
MSQLLDSVLRQQRQRNQTVKGILKFRQDYGIPQSDNNSEDASFEPNFTSNRKIELQQPEKQSFKGDCLSPDPDDDDDSLAILQIETKQKVNLWVHGGLRIMFYITKFSKQMKTYSTEVKFKSLTNNILNLISDSASDADILLHKLNKVEQVMQSFKWFINQVPVLDPDSVIKVLWDIFVLTQIIINIFYIPMKLGFDFEREDLLTSIFLETLPSLTFVLDIVLTFFTAYYSQGQIHRDKQQILKHYVNTNFAWDLMIVIPFILSSYSVPYTEYILLLRVTKVKSMIESIEEVTNPSNNIQTLLELFKSIFLVSFVSHFCACLWNLIGENELESGLNSWLVAKDITEANWSTKYIHAFYFSTITTLTIGYGDIVPQTDLERIYVIIMAMVICGLFGYTISSIGNILKQFTEKEQQFKQQMMHINSFLKKKKINKQLMLQVRKYFEYYLKMEQQYNEFGEKMMSNLDKKLKEQVAIDMYCEMLKKSRLIRQTLSLKSVHKLCSYVHEIKVPPEEIVANQNEQANKLIFLQRGELSDQKLRETTLTKIDKGKFVGEKEFITQARYEYTIRSVKFCQIAFVNYDDFLRIIREDSLEEENYCMLRDQMLFTEEKQNYGEVCYICKWTHQFKKCPLVFVHFNQDRIRKKFMITEDMDRLYHKRRSDKKNHERNIIREHALALIVNENMVAIDDLTDQYLNMLGFNMDDDEGERILKSIKTQKSSKSLIRGLTGLEQMDGESSENGEDPDGVLSQSKIQKSSRYIQLQSIEQKKVKFSDVSEPEPKNLRAQNSFKRKADNRQRTFKRLTQLSNNRFTNISIISSEQHYQNQSGSHQNSIVQRLRKNNNNSNSFTNFDQEMQYKTQSKLEIVASNVVNQLDEVLSHKQGENKQQRVDFELDRYFITTYYFTNSNLDKVLQKLKKPKKVSRSDHLQSIISKSKIKPSLYSPRSN